MLITRKITTYRYRIARIPTLLLTLLGFCFYPNQLYAAAQGDSAFFFEPKNSIEISGSYEALSPHETYGDWKSFSVTYHRRERPDFNWFAQVTTASRKEGSGQLGAVGAYKDWSDSFYTYTSLSAGTSSDFLPKVRVDQDLNLKLGSQKDLVWTVGGSYIKYFDDHKDSIVSTGFTKYYSKNWDAGYRIFKSQSDPGSVTSYSHLFFLGHGKDKQQMTTISYSIGNQAYMATAFLSPSEVRNYSRLVTLNHRQWVDQNHGFFEEVSYLNLKNAYHKLGISLGVFNNF